MLDQERAFYATHLSEWMKTIPYKFVVVKGETLVGTYDTVEQALAAGASKFGLKPFLVRRVGQVEEEAKIPALSLGLISCQSSIYK